MKSIGYARLASEPGPLDEQVDALRKAGCRQVFSEYGSGNSIDRPELRAALAALEPGDEFLVTGLDRLARDFTLYRAVLATIAEKQATFRSLDGADPFAAVDANMFRRP